MLNRFLMIVFWALLIHASANAQTQSPGQAAGESKTSPEITKIAIGFGPQGIAFTEGSIWVAYGNDQEFGVAQIDEDTNQVVARIPTGRWPVGAAAGEGSIWIVNRDDGTVTRVDPDSNRVIATIRVGRKPVAVDVAEGSIWVTNSGAGTVSRIDPHSNTVIAVIHVGSEPFGLSSSSGMVWVVNAGGPLSHSGSLVCIDAKSNGVTKKIKVPWSNFVLAHGQDVWVGTLQGDVIRIDRQSGAVLSRIRTLGAVGGLAASKNYLWVANNADGTLNQIVDITSRAHYMGKDEESRTHFDLSGKPATNESPMGGPSETVSKWDSGKLVVTWTGESAVAGGPKVVRKETRSLSADGKTMTVESVRGSSPAIILVYEKK